MKIIDTHLHFWELENNINSWVGRQSDNSLKRNYLPDDIVNASDNDLLGVVHVEAHDSAIPTTVEVEWLQNKMQNKNLQYKHIAFIDITLSPEEFKNKIEQLKSFKNVVGIRHILSYNPKFKYNPNDVDLSQDTNILINLQCLAVNNLIFDCQVYSNQMRNILNSIVQSKVITVIDHMLLPAWDNYNDEDHKIWQNMINEISKYDNIYLKLSGIDMFQQKSNFEAAVKYCLDNFPRERLVYGSNYPVSFNHDYNAWANYLNDLDMSNTDKEQIFYKNAMKLFKFN